MTISRLAGAFGLWPLAGPIVRNAQAAIVFEMCDSASIGWNGQMHLTCHKSNQLVNTIAKNKIF